MLLVLLSHLRTNRVCCGDHVVGMKETFAREALVKDIRPPVFSALLTYIYTDTLQLEKPEDIMELLVAANQV